MQVKYSCSESPEQLRFACVNSTGEKMNHFMCFMLKLRKGGKVECADGAPCWPTEETHRLNQEKYPILYENG